MSQKFNTTIAVIGIDIGKNSFHVVGHDERGAIMLRQKWSRRQVEARVCQARGGAPLGAVVLVPLPEMLRNTAQYQALAYGILLLLLQLFLPDGIIGLVQRLRGGRSL